MGRKMYTWWFEYHLAPRGGGERKSITVQAATKRAAIRKALAEGADFSKCDGCGDYEWHLRYTNKPGDDYCIPWQYLR